MTLHYDTDDTFMLRDGVFTMIVLNGEIMDSAILYNVNITRLNDLCTMTIESLNSDGNKDNKIYIGTLNCFNVTQDKSLVLDIIMSIDEIRDDPIE